MLIVASAISFYFYNKGPVDVEHASAKKVEAVDLYRAYASDSVSAQQQFNGEVLEVKGMVEELKLNQQNEQLVLLKTGEEGAYINCTIEEKQPATISKGDMVSLKGICNGLGQAEPDLGIKADLYLSRVYIK